MYRSSLTLAFVVLCSAGAAASDLDSVYVAPVIFGSTTDGAHAPSSAPDCSPGIADGGGACSGGGDGGGAGS